MSEKDVNVLVNHLKIENFRLNSSVNFDMLKELGILKTGEQDFIRKGKNGGWIEVFDKELNKRADDWIAENLKSVGINFPKEI